jgi:hypothetical protein
VALTLWLEKSAKKLDTQSPINKDAQHEKNVKRVFR